MKFTIAEARRMRGITQIQAARALGLNEHSYRRRENMEIEMTKKEADMFCDLVGLSAESVIFYR